ncbi:DUF4185 domain-containing protein [Nocardioides baculatus]|uniref:DUF4185 domain-containing protein n=1 Tax=Nocardioides baculatus TaxID=2801337 RepID=A0ABS1L6K9_9ACTN|nr:DUF4185 domain-containing protein [Nocardioides baculatus]MBL0747073.1 DUF4185 domain-containing protein [Nocardioides baculatus]
MPMVRLLRRPAVLACVLLVLGELVLLGALVRDPRAGGPHDVPVEVVAPALVAESLAEQAESLAGHPFAASAVAEDDATASRGRVADGSVVATLLVDLRGTEDTLVLHAGADPALARAVTERVDRTEATRDRTIVVERVGPTGPIGAGGARLLALASTLAGLALAAVVAARRGPVAASLGAGVRRALLVGVASLVVGGGAVVLLGLPALATPVVTLHVLAVSLLALALQSMFGRSGLVVAAVAGLGLTAPLLARTDPHLLPTSWARLATWSPSGAAFEGVDSLVLFGGSHLLQPALVLLAWTTVAVLALLSARWVRRWTGEVPDTSSSYAGLGGRTWAVLAAVVPVAALLIGGAVLVPDDTAATADLPSQATETRCLATGRLRTVGDLNRVAGRLRGSAAFRGGDVGADVQLQDGRRLWVFGDTLRGGDFGGQGLVRNSMLVIGPDCLSVVLPADRGAVIPDRPSPAGGSGAAAARVGYWPMSIGRVERPGYDLVAVAAQRVRTVGSGVFDFENLGTSIAVFVVPAGQPPQLVDQRDIGPDDADPGRPTWGAASLVTSAADPWVYLYGTSRPDTAGIFGYALHVARVRPDDLLDETRWRYWDGTSWSSRAADAATLIPSEGGVSQTLSVFEVDGTWYALSKRDEVLGTDLTVWTAPGPTGPFTRQPALAQLPSDAASGLLRYMPLAHPDLLPRPGTMVVSYSRNSTDFGEVLEDPLLYRPHFLRVTLP